MLPLFFSLIAPSAPPFTPPPASPFTSNLAQASPSQSEALACPSEEVTSGALAPPSAPPLLPEASAQALNALLDDLELAGGEAYISLAPFNGIDMSQFKSNDDGEIYSPKVKQGQNIISDFLTIIRAQFGNNINLKEIVKYIQDNKENEYIAKFRLFNLAPSAPPSPSGASAGEALEALASTLEEATSGEAEASLLPEATSGASDPPSPSGASDPPSAPPLLSEASAQALNV